MDLIEIKERASRIRFFFQKIKYGRTKHFYFSIIGLILVLIAIFLVIYFNQSLEIKRKENILKSYYGQEETPGSMEGQVQVKESGENIKGGAFTEVSQENMEDIDNTGDLIKAYICGEVKHAAVYEFENGKRIVDLLEMAGGPSEDASLIAVNLAQRVIDGQRIYIPSKEEVESGSYILSVQDTGLIGDGTGDVFSNMAININSAGISELQSLPGIGPVTAQYIIDYRNKRGPFGSKDELKNVTGIGEKKYEKIKDAISI